MSFVGAVTVSPSVPIHFPASSVPRCSFVFADAIFETTPEEQKYRREERQKD